MDSEGYGKGRGFGVGIPKPVKVGDELDVTIEAVASKGDGIAKKDGFVIFVPGTKTGETVRVKINSVKRTCAEGEVLGGSGAPSSEEATEATEEKTEAETPSEEATEAAATEGETSS